MAETVNINGEIVSRENAVISIFDHGFLFGDSVYEVVATKNGKLFTVDEHFERLKKSASKISLELTWDKLRLLEEVKKTIIVSGNSESYTRIIVTRGVGEVNIETASCGQPNWIIIVKELLPYPKSYYENGVGIVIVNIKRNSRESLNPAIKTGNYLNNVLAMIEAKKHDAYDGLMLNKENFVTECTTSNFYIVKDRVVKTPSIDCGILIGITRGLAIDVAMKNNIPVSECLITREDVFNADEAFVTSTTKGLMPVTSCDGMKIGNGLVGDVTKRLTDFYDKRVAEISIDISATV